VGEELSPAVARVGDVVWIVDPLDGTTNFLHGYPQYAVSIGALVEGAPGVGVVHDVARDRVYWGASGLGAWEGERRLHVSRLTEPRHALVGTGFPFKNLPLLQRYTQALRSRNALLKRPVLDPPALEGFSRELVSAGQEIIRLRRELVPQFSPLARTAYQRISNDAEEPRIEYQSSVKKDFAVELAQSRARERTYRTTLIGPHRDELQLLLNETSAAQFGSEGQKRTLAIALKMAQAEYLTGIHGSAPVLLIDDVMGELDAKRRAGFLPLLERSRETSGQVFMTATEENWPRELGRDLQRWEVKTGSLQKISTPNIEHPTTNLQ